MKSLGVTAGVTARMVAAGVVLAAGVVAAPGLVASAHASSGIPASAAASAPRSPQLAPLKAARPGKAIAGKYIVVLKPADEMPDVLRTLWNQRRVNAEPAIGPRVPGKISR